MNAAVTMSASATGRDYIVRAPRSTDGIGKTLRNAFAAPALPADMERLLRKLDARH